MNRVVRLAALRTLLLLVSAAAGLGLAEAALALHGDKPHWKYTRTWATDDVASRYKLTPGLYPDLDGVPVRISSYGTRGPEPRRPEILSLGDSCTFGVRLREEDTYAALLSARGFETVNAGVPGYNTYSGLRHLQNSALLSLHPKLVTIDFGWNDHWRALATEKTFERLRYLAQYSRLASRLLPWQESLYGSEQWDRYRWIAQVPLPQFKANLRAMIAASRRAGAVVVLITAPSEPRLLRGKGVRFAAFQDHARYVQAVRETAAETGAGLIDLDLEMRRRASADPHEYFLDPVHMTAKGHRVLADLLIPWARSAR